MPSASTCSRAAQSGPTYSIAAALRILVCLVIVVALPAQAVSASVERVWNAAHIHVNRAGDDSLLNATRAPAALPLQGAEHFPMQRLRDIAEGRIPVEGESVPDDEASYLLAHAQEHRAGTRTTTTTMHRVSSMRRRMAVPNLSRPNAPPSTTTMGLRQR